MRMLTRTCLRPPIPEIEEAAFNLAAGVAAHRRGDTTEAEAFFVRADDKLVWEWTDSVWGKQSRYTGYRAIADAPPVLGKADRLSPRDASATLKQQVHARDGHYCRFCGIPVIRSAVRSAVAKAYPNAVQWGDRNTLQHAGFQCMWAQYDHILPNARGGATTLDNVYLTCAACNYGRMSFTLEEVGLAHPGLREPRLGAWSGLEEFLQPCEG